MFRVSINISSINASVKYDTYYNYSILDNMENLLYKIEFLGDKRMLHYRVPDNIYQFVKKENESIGGSSFHITALVYHIGQKLTMFVSVSKKNRFQEVELL